MILDATKACKSGSSCGWLALGATHNWRSPGSAAAAGSAARNSRGNSKGEIRSAIRMPRWRACCMRPRTSRTPAATRWSYVSQSAKSGLDEPLGAAQSCPPGGVASNFVRLSAEENAGLLLHAAMLKMHERLPWVDSHLNSIELQLGKLVDHVALRSQRPCLGANRRGADGPPAPRRQERLEHLIDAGPRHRLRLGENVLSRQIANAKPIPQFVDAPQRRGRRAGADNPGRLASESRRPNDKALAGELGPVTLALRQSGISLWAGRSRPSPSEAFGFRRCESTR